MKKIEIVAKLYALDHIRLPALPILLCQKLTKDELTKIYICLKRANNIIQERVKK
jgi:hypothetical protein